MGCFPEMRVIRVFRRGSHSVSTVDYFCVSQSVCSGILPYIYRVLFIFSVILQLSSTFRVLVEDQPARRIFNIPLQYVRIDIDP